MSRESRFVSGDGQPKNRTGRTQEPTYSVKAVFCHPVLLNSDTDVAADSRADSCSDVAADSRANSCPDGTANARAGSCAALAAVSRADVGADEGADGAADVGADGAAEIGSTGIDNGAPGATTSQTRPTATDMRPTFSLIHLA